MVQALCSVLYQDYHIESSQQSCGNTTNNTNAFGIYCVPSGVLSDGMN